MKSRYPTFPLRVALRSPTKSSSSLTPTINPTNRFPQLRRVSVTGENAKQVKATSNLIEKDLLRFSATIGGASFRRVAGMFLSVVFLTFLGLSGAWWWRTRIYSALGMLICSTVGLLLVLLLPWDRYLPGFALYQSYS